MEEEFEIVPAQGLYNVLQYKGFAYLTRRWKRIMLKLYSGGTLEPSMQAYWWQWYKAIVAVLQHSGWWDMEGCRPLTAKEYTDKNKPRIPGEEEWKKLYPGSPKWRQFWQDNPEKRTQMQRYQYRVEKGLETHAAEIK